jgi:CheY-like chemotaxis protein/anti-sigma regulatory factor (Ser/Thr protein kinase)
MKRILVVDDDRTTRHLMQALLRKAGYEVTLCADGREALDTLARDNFDLVLLDVWMPELTGLDVLNRMSQSLGMPPAIVMTTDDTPQTLLRAVREQAYDFVHKPVEAEPFLELVQATLERKRERLPIEVLSARPNWVELLVPCDMETAERIQNFLSKLDADLPEDVRCNVGQAFHELLLNAIEWGGKLDPTRKVRIAYVRTSRLLIYRIADPGKGFSFDGLNHAAVGQPRDKPITHAEVREQKGIRPGGFGLLMTSAMVDELVYNEKQNEVLFVKFLDPPRSA